MTYIKVCVPNKQEHLNLSFFSMITEIYESKTLTKLMVGNVIQSKKKQQEMSVRV